MSILRNAVTVGGWVLISRMLGFARDIFLADRIGTGWVADAWAVAFRFPNLFRRLFGEGAFNAAFVPMYAKRLEQEGPAPARRLAEEVLSVALPVLLGVTVIGMLAMPWIMIAYAPGFIDDPEKFDLAVILTQIAFPYLLFMSLVALYAGILNTHGRFGAATAVQSILNIALIVSMVLAWAVLNPALESPVWAYALAFGVAAAGAFQFLFLVWALGWRGVRLALTRPRLSPDSRRMFRLMVPGIIAGGVSQISIFVATVVAGFQDGGPAILYYADRIYQFPLGIVGVAMGVVLLPAIARHLQGGRADLATYWQNRGIELSALLTLPAAVALVTISLPICIVLFERGAFTRESSLAVATVLVAFGFGLPAFILNKVFTPGFFARQDTRTPMLFALISLCIDTTLAVSLFFLFGVLAIPIATATGAWIYAAFLGVTLWRRGHLQPDARLKTRLIRIALASAIMGAALIGLEIALWDWFQGSTGRKLLALLILCGAGFGVYVAAAFALKAVTLAELKEQFTREKGAPREAAPAFDEA